MGLIVRIAKILLFIVVMLVLAVSLTSAWVVWRIRASTPQIEGQIEVAGLDGPVVIARDEHGVPHIFGATDADVFFGLGYAHAQDRMFQMELVRRAMEGRLSEIVPSVIGGEAVVRADARARILGHHLTAQAIAASFEGPMAEAVDAYVAGVNALIGAPGYVPPPEYTLLLAGKPEAWDRADTAAVWVYMTEDLVTGAGEEYERRVASEVLSPAQLGEFFGGYPSFGERSLVLSDLLAANPALARAAGATDGGVGLETGPTPGSNNWVVDGEHTRSGSPMLANDPHLALRAPNVWYLAHLALPEAGDVVGGTIPGGPIVVLGHNERIAWGFTNTGYDVADYVTGAAAAANAESREERIVVRGGAAVTITARETADGPVLDPAYFNLGPFGDEPVVLRTTADDRDNSSASFAYALMTADNWTEVVAASGAFTAPMQNILYADVDGNIGYLSPGRMPLRDAAGNWTGTIPTQDLPRVYNPASGIIATANNRIVPDEYPHPLPGEFATYRLLRIHERLGETQLHDAESFRSIQLDVTSELALRLLPSIERASPITDQGRVVQSMLIDWSGSMGVGSPEALAFEAWLEAFHDALYADELGELFPRFNGIRAVFVDRVLSGELSQWCDDATTTLDETCADTAGKALDLAAARLFEVYGADPLAWRWGAAHQAVFPHPLMTGTGVPLLDDLFTVRVEHGGDSTTVNVGSFNYGGLNFNAVHAASMRAIYDLSDLDASLFMHAPGQSGHPLSPHYRDLAPLWAAGTYIEIPTDWSLRQPPPGMSILELTPQ